MAKVSSGARLQTNAPTPSPTSATPRQSPARAGAHRRDRLFERPAVVVVGQFLRHARRPESRHRPGTARRRGSSCRGQHANATFSEVDDLVHAEERSSIDDGRNLARKGGSARTELTPVRTVVADVGPATPWRPPGRRPHRSAATFARRPDRRRRGCRARASGRRQRRSPRRRVATRHIGVQQTGPADERGNE